MDANSSGAKKEHAPKQKSATYSTQKKISREQKEPKASSAPLTKKVATYGEHRILLVAEVRGQLSQLNNLIEETKADYVISCGNFGFFDEESAATVPEHCLPNATRPAGPRSVPRAGNYKGEIYGELAIFARDEIELRVPVYTIYGSFEDVRVVNKFRNGELKVKNLFLLDENHSYVIANGLRVFGLGGLLEYNKLFDYSSGAEFGIAGSEGRMWPTAIQIGTLIAHAQSVFNAKETRIFASFTPAFSDGLLTQLAIQLQAHVTIGKCSISCDTNFYECLLHKREDIRARIDESVAELAAVWQVVQAAVTEQCSDDDWTAVERAMKLADVECTESYYRSTWHFGICNIRRKSTTVLLSSNTLGFETRHPGIDVRRLYDDAASDPAKKDSEEAKKRTSNA